MRNPPVLIFVLIVAGVFHSLEISAKPPYHVYKNYPASTSAQKSTGGSTADAAGALKDLQHELDNHELELRMFEERLNTQETILDSLRQQFLDSNHANQQMMKGNTVSLEKRVAGVDSSISGISKDIRELQTHANESSKALSQYKEKISDLERQIGQLQNAVDSMLSALQIDEIKSDAEGHSRVYEVKPGDILEKIARKNNTSVKKLKELNGLSNDRIFVGQKIKLP